MALTGLLAIGYQRTFGVKVLGAREWPSCLLCDRGDR